MSKHESFYISKNLMVQTLPNVWWLPYTLWWASKTFGFEVEASAQKQCRQSWSFHILTKGKAWVRWFTYILIVLCQKHPSACEAGALIKNKYPAAPAPVLGASVYLEPSGTVKSSQTTIFYCCTAGTAPEPSLRQQACYGPGECNFLYLHMNASVFPRLTL